MHKQISFFSLISNKAGTFRRALITEASTNLIFAFMEQKKSSKSMLKSFAVTLFLKSD